MPRLEPEEARQRFLSSPVARLATVTPAGEPHLVPVTFAAPGPDALVSAVDHKPKRTTALARLTNIAAHPAVALLVDHYDEDWSTLWWARADGRAEVLAADGDVARWSAAIDALVERYGQYREIRPGGPVIAVTVARWSGWQAGPAPPDRPNRTN